MESSLREKTIVRTSVIGIAVNILLAAGKAIVGIFASSIAIVLDALNNLSDALSSIITIVGAKLALRPADKEHPFGHGRSEYLAALIISVIILYAGVTSLVEAVKKIREPQTPEYTTISLILVFAAVIVKIFLGLFVKSAGKKVNSQSLVASGQDALMDSIVSASTGITAVVFILTGKSFEAWLAAVISLLIIKSGIELVQETVSEILGRRIDASLSKDLKATIVSADPEITGAYDLTLNNYGPDRYLGSVHIEVPAEWSASKIDDVTRRIQKAVYDQHSVILSAVGIYSVNSKNSIAAHIKDEIETLRSSYPDILQIHGFYADVENKKLSLDVVVSFDSDDMKTCFHDFKSELEEHFSDYEINIQMDSDVSD